MYFPGLTGELHKPKNKDKSMLDLIIGSVIVVTLYIISKSNFKPHKEPFSHNPPITKITVKDGVKITEKFYNN